MKHNDNNHSSNSPHNQKHSAEDPRLTAYALGEMDASERAAFEAEIASNPAAQATIAEIRSLTGQLEAAFAAEPAPETAPLPEQDWRSAREAEARRARERDRERKPFSFPYFLVAGLATACFALIFFTIVKPDYEKRELQKKQAALAAAAATGTIVIDGKTYVEFTPQNIVADNTANLVTGTVFASISIPPAPAQTIGATTAAPASDSFILSGSSLADLSTNTQKLSIEGKGDKQNLATLGQGSISLTGSAFSERQTWNANSSQLGATFGNGLPAANTGGVNGAIYLDGDSSHTGVTVANGGRLITNNAIDGIELAGFNAPSKPTIITRNGGHVNAMPATSLTVGTNSTASNFTIQIIPSPGTESYAARTDNTFQNVLENPLSTFSADIDTASYTNVRRFLNSGRLPPRDAVRAEEMINYFNYNYAPPAKDSAAPFAATMEVAAAPWNPEHRLVRIGIKGRELDNATRPPANLVFLIDISGSMDTPNRLPLVKESMRMLVNRLRADDRIAIVTYSSTIDLALPSTTLTEKTKILDALDALRATGGTNGGKGIQLAYEIAKANFFKDGANRVILCTDGDFNIGITNRDDLQNLIAEKAKSGVYLTVLGYGMGNLKDSTLQLLADKGNGNYGYIESRDEARRILVEQTAGTLVTIAKDVKLQVEFNPAQASAYRLIGYEKRLLAKEDFNNDKVDAGEIGAGHTVTALYEVIPAKANAANTAASDIPANSVDALKYQTQTTVTTAPKLELKGELLTLKIRYKAPSSDVSDKLEFTLEDKGAGFLEASPDFKFTCSVATFAMILRNNADRNLVTYDNVLQWADSGMGGATTAAEYGRRSEFTDLVRRAKEIGIN